MIIDVYCHHSTREVEELIERARSRPAAGGAKKSWSPQSQFPFPIKSSSVESRLQFMDKYGIVMQALSQSAHALYGLEAEEAAQICARSNDENYILCKAYPDRFVNVGILSLLDMKTALDEFNRLINELDSRGITVATNQNGNGLDSPDYFPLYEKMVGHDLPLFLHPTYWESYPLVDQVKGWGMMAVFGWPFDTTQAVWRLISGGVFDRFPTLKVVTHHMGAMFPYLSGRVNTLFRGTKEKPGGDISNYYRNIYGDTAISGGVTEAYNLGYAFFGPDRLMYASDFPFGPEAGELHIRGNLSGVKSMKIPIEDMEKILSGNAKKLLKIK